MAKLFVTPGANIFNRNYKGSTVYTRNNTILLRQKHITSQNPQNKIVFTSQLLKKSVIDFTNLNSSDRQSWDDYLVLNPQYKSSINIMTKVNISKNFSIKYSFNPTTSINPASEPPDFPILNIYNYNFNNNTFDIEWEPSIVANSQIRFFILCTYGALAPSSTYFPFHSISSASYDFSTLFFPNLRFYDFINAKAKYVNPDGLESIYGPIETYAI